MGRKPKSYTAGQQFGHWVVIDGIVYGNPSQIDVKCECGTIKRIDAYSLTSGRSTSCGCQLKKRTAENNPNWKGVNGVPGTTIYYNSVRTGLNYDQLVGMIQNQTGTCTLTGGTISSVEPIDSNQPISTTNGVWVNNSIAPMIRQFGVQNTLTVVNSVRSQNIFEQLGMKPTINGE